MNRKQPCVIVEKVGFAAVRFHAFVVFVAVLVLVDVGELVQALCR